MQLLLTFFRPFDTGGISVTRFRVKTVTTKSKSFGCRPWGLNLTPSACGAEAIAMS